MVILQKKFHRLPYAKELMTLIQNTCTANGILCSPKECFTYLHEFPERYVQQTLF